MHPAPLPSTAQPTPSMRGASGWTRRDIPYWAYFAAAGLCALLVPTVAAVGASLEGAHALGRVAVAASIALLAGAVIVASAAGINAADRAQQPSATPVSDQASPPTGSDERAPQVPATGEADDQPADDSSVPEKQLGRWKDDGGAVFPAL